MRRSTSIYASIGGGAWRARRRELPVGTVTFLLTDIEGSTRLWESEPEAMEALQQHDRLLTEVIEGRGGAVVTSRGEVTVSLLSFTARCRRWRRPACASFG